MGSLQGVARIWNVFCDRYDMPRHLSVKVA